MGLIWGRQDPGGPYVGPMNFAIWDVKRKGYLDVLYLMSAYSIEMIVAYVALEYSLALNIFDLW